MAENKKTKFQNLAVRLINDTFGDIAEQVTHRTSSNRTYDELTGEVSYVNDDETVNVILRPFAEQKFNGQDVLSTDMKMLVAFIDSDKKFTPQSDLIITQAGIEYNVYQVNLSVAEALYTIQLRQRNVKSTS